MKNLILNWLHQNKNLINEGQIIDIHIDYLLHEKSIRNTNDLWDNTKLFDISTKIFVTLINNFHILNLDAKLLLIIGLKDKDINVFDFDHPKTKQEAIPIIDNNFIPNLYVIPWGSERYMRCTEEYQIPVNFGITLEKNHQRYLATYYKQYRYDKSMPFYRGLYFEYYGYGGKYK